VIDLRIESELLEFAAFGEVSAQQLRSALQSLHLRSFSMAEDDRSPSPTKFVDALCSSELPNGGGTPSLLSVWSITLTALECALPVCHDIDLLTALASLSWPLLTLVQAGRDTGHQAATDHVVELLHPTALSLLSQMMQCTDHRMPQLKILVCDGALVHENTPAVRLAFTALWCCLLPRFRNLVQLTIGWCILQDHPQNFTGIAPSEQIPLLQQSVISPFQLIGPDSFPQLLTLRMECVLPPMQDAAECEQVRALLRRMPLTKLTSRIGHILTSADWLALVDELPSLEYLTLNKLYRPDSFYHVMHSVANARALVTLSLFCLKSQELSLLLSKWRNRCQADAAIVDVAVASSSAPLGATAALSPPLIRSLHVHEFLLSSETELCRMLGCLPHLTDIAFIIKRNADSAELNFLGSLSQLRNISIHMEGFYSANEPRAQDGRTRT
jgi:hypothetical protein